VQALLCLHGANADDVLGHHQEQLLLLHQVQRVEQEQEQLQVLHIHVCSDNGKCVKSSSLNNNVKGVKSSSLNNNVKCGSSSLHNNKKRGSSLLNNNENN